MTNYTNGRIKGNQTVHLFSEGARTPTCGSGNTHNINGRLRNRVELTSDELTCKKCKAVLYGGKPSDY